jgi:DNA-binding CsgD family transcriptional regulator
MDDEPADARAAPITLSTRAHLHAAAGHHEQALADLRECGRLEDAWGTRTPADSWWRSDAVTLLASLGRRDEARALSGEDLDRCRAFGEPRALGAALRAAGLAHGEVDLLQASVETFACTPARLEHATSLLELGAALRRAGRRADARAPLRDALELARGCHAGAVAARARDELVAAGARPRRDPVDARTRLTASERRVARMAAEGLTNREIAQSLFLTEKTIEYHLTGVYRKLEIASRSQLAGALAAAD